MAGQDPKIHIETSADTRALDKLDKKLDGSKKHMAGLAKQIAETDDAGKKADLEKAFGDEGRAVAKLDRVRKKLAETGGAAKDLQAQIKRTEESISHLEREYTRTKDKGVRRELRQQRVNLGGLTSMLPGGGKAAGGLLGSGIGGVGDIMSALPAQAKVVGVAGIAAAVAASAPMIGAAVNAALLAGVGAGGLAAGIASAVRDPAVKGEFARLGTDFKQMFDDFGDSYKQPLMRGAQFLRAELADVRGEWTDGISGLSGAVEPLTKGISGLFKNMTPGAMRALKTAETILTELGDELPGLGADLDDMFDSFADGGAGAAEGMKALINLTGDAAVSVGNVVEYLSKWYDLSTDIASAQGRLGAAGAGVFGPLGSMAHLFLQESNNIDAFMIKAGPALEDVAGAAADAEREVKGLNRATNELLERFLSESQLADQIKAGWDNITKSVEENGTTLADNTVEGRANRDMLRDQIGMLIEQRQKMIDSGQSVAHANDVYNAGYDALVRLATSLHISREAVLKFLAPWNQLQSKTVTLSVKQIFTSQGQAYKVAGGPNAFMAEGGVIAAANGLATSGGVVSSPTVLFGERRTKREVFVPQAGISRARGLGLAGVAAGMHGGTVVPNEAMSGGGGGGAAATLTVAGGGDRFAQMLVEFLHYGVRTGLIQLTTDSQGRVRVG